MDVMLAFEETQQQAAGVLIKADDHGAGQGHNFPAGLRVLVVDDDPLCLRVVEQMLRKCQYEVTTCANATTALNLLRDKAGEFDMVLSDVYMPDMDGFKLLEMVGLELDLPVIMMSSNGDTNNVLRGVTHGACDYLIKPVRLEELRNMWQHVVRRRKQHVQDLDSDEQSQDKDDDSSRKRKELGFPGDMTNGDCRGDDNNASKKARVVWSVDMHQQFVNAVNQLGIDKAVPKKILEIMNVDGLTRENVASHLQKYRLYLKRVAGVQPTAPRTKGPQQAAQQAAAAAAGLIPPPGTGPGASPAGPGVAPGPTDPAAAAAAAAAAVAASFPNSLLTNPMLLPNPSLNPLLAGAMGGLNPLGPLGLPLPGMQPHLGLMSGLGGAGGQPGLLGMGLPGLPGMGGLPGLPGGLSMGMGGLQQMAGFMQGMGMGQMPSLAGLGLVPPMPGLPGMSGGSFHLPPQQQQQPQQASSSGTTTTGSAPAAAPQGSHMGNNNAAAGQQHSMPQPSAASLAPAGQSMVGGLGPDGLSLMGDPLTPNYGMASPHGPAGVAPPQQQQLQQQHHSGLSAAMNGMEVSAASGAAPVLDGVVDRSEFSAVLDELYDGAGANNVLLADAVLSVQGDGKAGDDDFLSFLLKN